VNSKTDEQEELRSVSLQNAKAIFLARQRAEEELLRTQEALERQTHELAQSIATLRRSEQELADFFENVSVGLHWVGPDGIIFRVNQTELDLLGYSRDEYVGHHVSEFHVDPDASADMLRRLAANERIRDYPAAMRCKDGSIKHVLIDSSAMWRDGEFIHSRCVTHDVTDRKGIEETQIRLAAIVESSDDAIIAKTLDSRILSWNAGAERLFGYTAQEAVGHSITMLIPADRQDEERAILQRLQRGEGIEHYDTVRVSKSGRHIDVSLTISPLRDGAGRIIAASSIARDITSKKRYEGRVAAQYGVTRALAESTTLSEAAPRILRAISEHLGWDVGALWYVDQSSKVLRCLEVWHRSSLGILQFAAACRQHNFEPGIGLPGRVWQIAKPVWIRDVLQDTTFARWASAAAEGLHGAFGFPIILGNEVLGVIEFFSPEIRQLDDDVLQMMTAVGSQVGQFIERKRAEEALRDSEQRFRLMAETIPSIVWTASPDGTITYANERWYAYTGLTPEQNTRQWSDIVLHPNDRQRCLEAWTIAQQRGTEYGIEVRNRRHDGAYRWFVTRAVPLRDPFGSIVQWFGTTTDVDDRRRAEQTSRFLGEASASLVELTDHESTLQRVANLAVPAFADWCAVDMVEADGSIRRLEAIHPESSTLRAAATLLRRAEPSDVHGVMKVLRTGEADWVPLLSQFLGPEATQDQKLLHGMRRLDVKSYMCVPLRSRARTLGAMTFVNADSGRVFDGTDLAAAMDLAHRTVIALENANLVGTLRENDRRKDEFLAMLAHELRNPLAPIRNAVNIFRGQAASVRDLQWATDVIDRQSHQLTRLVDDLLDVARISRGKITLRKEVVDLATIVNHAVEASRPLIEKWGHELTVMIPPATMRLEADPTRLTQVILNLLSNAAKYTDERGRIWLTAEEQDEHLLIRVKDNGIGIPADMLPEIFDMFAQVDRSRERSEGGLGIGLKLVQRLVEMHGGIVEARSEGPGKGSEFVVRLPVALAAKGQVESSSDNGEPVSAAVLRRILIVDDNRDAADSLGMLLQMMGNEVRTAHDGLDAVAAAAAFQPDVVLLDIGLPKLNGYEVACRIREQPGGAGMLLIALTGWGQDEDRRRSKAAGFDHHMTKPIEFDALKKLLSETTPGMSRRHKGS
jgi:PAS domain S-box-containing protein